MAMKDVLGGIGSALGGADWGSIAEQVAGVGAPILGTLLGGAVGGPMGASLGKEAGNLIANALGVAPTPEAVSQAIQDDPAAVEKIKALEMAHGDDMREVLARLQDVQSARQMQTAAVQAGSELQWATPVLSAVVVLGFFINVGALFFVPRDIPPNVLQLLNVSFGTFSAGFIQVLNFWFGTSRSSEKNGTMLRSIAGTTTGSPTPDAVSIVHPSAALTPFRKRRMQ